MPNAMIRSVYLLALAGTLWVSSAHAQMSESDMLTRINHLEAQIRELTGTVEQLQYRNQQLEQDLQRAQAGGPSSASGPKPTAQYSSSPYSPNPPATGQYSPPAAGVAQYPPPAPPPYSPPGPPPYSPPAAGVAQYPPPAPPPYTPSSPAESAATPGHRGDAFNPALNPAAPGAPRALGTSTAATEPPPPVADSDRGGMRQPGAPLDLSSPPGGAGDLPPPPPVNPSGTGAMQAALPPTLPPNATPKDEYDLAYGYVLHKDYGPAADTFRDFLHKYPTDRMAADAQYWLGESLFQGQHYRDAAESFLAVSTKYDAASRAPEALMRLGQSLAALGEKEAACASLGEVLRKYPRASPAVKQNVDREQKRVHC
jgi:tol-pal system protein YbgF